MGTVTIVLTGAYIGLKDKLLRHRDRYFLRHSPVCSYAREAEKIVFDNFLINL